MTTTNKNIETATTTLGSVLYWRVPQDVAYKVETVQALAELNGFEADDFKAPTREAEVSRTCKSFRHQYGNTDKALQEVVKNNGSVKVWGLLGLRHNGDEEVTYTQDTTVTFNKADKSVTVTGKQAAEFYKRYEQFKDAIIDEDIRSFIQKVRAMCHGINLREGSGGIYFVPERFVGIMADAQKVLDELKCGAKVTLLPMQNTQGNREAIWASVEHEIGNTVERLVGEAANITSRVSSFAKKKDKLSELDNLMTVYRDLLGAEAEHEGLAERLNDASKQVAELMSGLKSTKRLEKEKTVKANGGTSVKTNQWVDAAKTVLATATGPMHVRDITEQALSDGLVTTTGKTPWNTMSARLGQAIRDGEVVSAGRGLYELAQG